MLCFLSFFFFFALFYSIPNLSYFNCIFTMEQSSSFFNDPFSFTCFLCCIVDSLFFLSQLLFYNFIPSFFFVPSPHFNLIQSIGSLFFDAIFFLSTYFVCVESISIKTFLLMTLWLERFTFN